MRKEIVGAVVDVVSRTIFPGRVIYENGVIVAVEEYDGEIAESRFIIPPFVDAHIHRESCMVLPSESARLMVQHGTVATVSDPHEIANVCGIEGVRFMMRDAARVPLKTFFGAPSCVPASSFGTAGATLSVNEVLALLLNDDLSHLAEVMDFPSVLARDPDKMEMIRTALNHGKRVDGHAPGLRGEVIKRYAEVGISTDHECFTLGEALDKLAAGMSVIIREGSAARNFEALHELIRTHSSRLMFCSDDLHPDDLLEGHINRLCRWGRTFGYNPIDLLCIASKNPIDHYKLPVGYLQKGQPADFVVVDSLEDFNVLETYIDGECVFRDGGVLFTATGSTELINNFAHGPICEEDIAFESAGEKVRAVRVIDREIVTEEVVAMAERNCRGLKANVPDDVLKLVVVNRYHSDAKPAVGFVVGFQLLHGAIASSVMHDCHNIIAVGTNDADIVAAVNAVIATKGGIASAIGGVIETLPLPVAGLMSDLDAETVARRYRHLTSIVNEQQGCPLHAPFMTLSFTGLEVIPALKLTDRGLVRASSSGLEFVEVAVK